MRVNLLFQGISTVLETSIGAPDPEDLAKASKENQAKKLAQPPEPTVEKEVEKEDEARGSGGDAFQFGSLLSGVTKFVETTGKQLIIIINNNNNRLYAHYKKIVTSYILLKLYAKQNISLPLDKGLLQGLSL